MTSRLLQLFAFVATLFAAGAMAAEDAAGPDEWATIDVASIFSFMAPAKLAEVPVQTIDSIGRQYENQHFTLIFDFGKYAGRFHDDDVGDSRFTTRPNVERVMVSGREAVILTGPADGSGGCDFISDLYIAGPSPDENLMMTGCGDRIGVRELRRIYGSIRFAAGAQSPEILHQREAR